MSKLLNRLKSMKSLKNLSIAQDEESDVTETPSDPSVKQAEAHLPDTSPSSSYQGGSPASNVVQTPTCPEAAEAVAELSPSRSRPSTSALMQSFSRKMQKPRQSVEFSLAEPPVRQKSFHGLKRNPSRSKSLATSMSSPNLQMPNSDTVCVLGKECRSRRRLTTTDNDASGASATLAELKGTGSGPGSLNQPLERRSSSTQALYQLVAPPPSPFRDVPLISGDSLGKDTPTSRASIADEAPLQAQYSIARPGSPRGPGLERRQLSRKLTAGRVVVSTEPLKEQKGDIMLPPQVVDFAADALASMGGSYTGEIEFSGGSARAIRRLSRNTSQEEFSTKPQMPPKAEIAAA